MSQSSKVGERGRLVADLVVGIDRVSLHLLPDKARACASNRLIKLPFDPELGTTDPNFRLLRAMFLAAEAELGGRPTGAS